MQRVAVQHAEVNARLNFRAYSERGYCTRADNVDARDSKRKLVFPTTLRCATAALTSSMRMMTLLFYCFSEKKHRAKRRPRTQ